MECEIPEGNPLDEEIVDILKKYKTIAVVGLSHKPEKDSYKVAKYLLENGYNVIPVNPGHKEILNLKSYPSLKSIPFKVDIVNIFLKPEYVPQVVEEAIEIGAKVIWMQIGVVNNSAAKMAKSKGLKVIQNKCIKILHQKYISGK